ncbi:FtsX-like permease family protein [Streptomyces alkaliterrae]|uniref:ABC transporter permease n=1 Tax=Streptomyces alkaliterrae TaxID=2213162 RepID=A0A7W3ZTU8_9ACTN|nr:ABC transporter permease [Streptomyces alkaliterrae]MBB1260142.1 ABC transporter permease [Streptomyces alkaliterrae]
MSPLRLAVWNVVASRRQFPHLVASATLVAVALSTALCTAVLAGDATGDSRPGPALDAGHAVPAGHAEGAGPAAGRPVGSGGGTSPFVVWSGVAALAGPAAVGAFVVGGRLARRREREIGVLKAVGFRDGDVVRMLFAEAGIVGVSAALLGAGGGWLLSAGAAALLGRRVDALPSLPAAVLATAVLLAVLAGATGPARRACRLTPLEAMRRDHRQR